jgi:hypothetical protein
MSHAPKDQNFFLSSVIKEYEKEEDQRNGMNNFSWDHRPRCPTLGLFSKVNAWKENKKQEVFTT